MLQNINLVAQDLENLFNTPNQQPTDQATAHRIIATNLENLLKTHCGNITDFRKVGNNTIGTYQFTLNGNTYAIKRTSQNMTKTYNGDVMAVQHLRSFYIPVTNDNYNTFVYILHAKYDPRFSVPNTMKMALLENINYSDFAIGNLGRAQLQLNRNSDISIPSNLNRRQWMKTFYNDFINRFIPQTTSNLNTDYANSTIEEAQW